MKIERRFMKKQIVKHDIKSHEGVSLYKPGCLQGFLFLGGSYAHG
jgi:hypothetical protein